MREVDNTIEGHPPEEPFAKHVEQRLRIMALCDRGGSTAHTLVSGLKAMQRVGLLPPPPTTTTKVHTFGYPQKQCIKPQYIKSNHSIGPRQVTLKSSKTRGVPVLGVVWLGSMKGAAPAAWCTGGGGGVLHCVYVRGLHGAWGVVSCTLGHARGGGKILIRGA